MRKLTRQIEELGKRLTPRQLVITQMLEWHEHDSLEALARYLEESAGEYDGIVFAKAMQGVKLGKDFVKQRNERLRAVSFFYDLAMDMNFAVHERIETLRQRLNATWYRMQAAVFRAGGADAFDPSRFEHEDEGLKTEVLLVVAEVQGTAEAVERINRDYFGGQNMLFPAQQPELYVLEEQAVDLLGFARLVFGLDREQVIARAEEEEGRVAERLVKGWTELAARKAAKDVPVPAAQPPQSRRSTHRR